MKKQVSARIPSQWGEFDVITYSPEVDDPMPHLAIIHPDLDLSEPPLVRVHSECLTGDLLRSRRCDCGEQLFRSLEMIFAEKGILLYLRQEGRGIGLNNKLKAYNLQDQGLNTVDANHQLGFDADERTYEIAHFILKDIGVQSLRLLTNNPLKIESLRQGGIKIVERVPIKIKPSEINKKYLKTKKDLLGHFLD